LRPRGRSQIADGGRSGLFQRPEGDARMTQPDSPTPPPQPPPSGMEGASAPASGGMFTPPPPPAIDADKDARLWGMLCHLTALSGLIGIPFGTILGPLIIWLIKRGEIPFVDDQGKESLNFQITVLLAALLLSPTICLAGVGIILLAALGVADIVLVII